MMIYVYVIVAALAGAGLWWFAVHFHRTDPDLAIPTPGPVDEDATIPNLPVVPAPRRRALAAPANTESWPPRSGQARTSTTGRHRPARRAVITSRAASVDSVTVALPASPHHDVRVAPYAR